MQIISSLRQFARSDKTIVSGQIKLQAMHHALPLKDIFPMHFCSIRAENNLS